MTKMLLLWSHTREMRLLGLQTKCYKEVYGSKEAKFDNSKSSSFFVIKSLKIASTYIITEGSSSSRPYCLRI